MRKKFVTSALTLGVATALVAGNGVVSAFAYSGDDAQKVEVIGKHQQPEITQIEDMPVNNEEAVEIAKKAIEEKFKVSLNGLEVWQNLATLEDMEGTFYFVSFEDQKYTYTDAELIEAKRNVKAGKDSGLKWNDIYIATVNAETGEIVSAEKNPTAPEGAN
ncbi:hypothetical protein ACIQAA_19060 [Neobacillus sp. NPDC093182]|uniref:hypothetical protein n=1 Tax=Neobacillus sp. NPDC093182 TaxID=3364297 RepID=UPI0037FF79E0